jgi:hypothetical protein
MCKKEVHPQTNLGEQLSYLHFREALLSDGNPRRPVQGHRAGLNEVAPAKARRKAKNCLEAQTEPDMPQR